MHILLISPYFSPAVGGVETHLDDLCSYLNQKKHLVFVRTYQAFGVPDRGASNERQGGVQVHRLWWPDFNLIFKLESYPVLKFFYLFFGLFFDCLLFLLNPPKKIDVIQAHGFIAALIAVILGKLFKKRVVVNTHVGFKLSKGFMTDLIKWTLLSSDKILVLTEGIKHSLIKLGIQEDKISVYHYWVDQKIFSPVKNAKSKLNWENKFVVLFVGRLIEVKGVRIIFELAKDLKNITFAIAGSGPLGDELKERSKGYKNIIFLGKINNEDLPLYYSGSDVLLIPSRVIKQEYEEGIPRVMIEALSCGLPVISTKTGGIPDVFSKEIGILVDDDSQMMESAINRISKKNEVGKMSDRCRKYALKLFSVKNAKIIENSLIS